MLAFNRDQGDYEIWENLVGFVRVEFWKHKDVTKEIWDEHSAEINRAFIQIQRNEEHLKGIVIDRDGVTVKDVPLVLKL